MRHFCLPKLFSNLVLIFKKTRNLNTFKHKIKHYCLNDLSNPNLWNVGRFDYALAIIKNIFLFIKQMFLHTFFLFSASLWLKHTNGNKAIRLFCVIVAILFFISLILLLISTFFFICSKVFYFFKVWLFSFCVPIWTFCFHGKIKLTYLLTYFIFKLFIFYFTSANLASILFKYFAEFFFSLLPKWTKYLIFWGFFCTLPCSWEM